MCAGRNPDIVTWDIDPNRPAEDLAEIFAALPKQPGTQLPLLPSDALFLRLPDSGRFYEKAQRDVADILEEAVAQLLTMYKPQDVQVTCLLGNAFVSTLALVQSSTALLWH
jgi:hypothetical protein